jgi:DNA (cytosine-5)-methyltransferase 1
LNAEDAFRAKVDAALAARKKTKEPAAPAAAPSPVTATTLSPVEEGKEGAAVPPIVPAPEPSPVILPTEVVREPRGRSGLKYASANADLFLAGLDRREQDFRQRVREQDASMPQEEVDNLARAWRQQHLVLRGEGGTQALLDAAAKASGPMGLDDKFLSVLFPIPTVIPLPGFRGEDPEKRWRRIAEGGVVAEEIVEEVDPFGRATGRTAGDMPLAQFAGQLKTEGEASKSSDVVKDIVSIGGVVNGINALMSETGVKSGYIAGKEMLGVSTPEEAAKERLLLQSGQRNDGLDRIAVLKQQGRNDEASAWFDSLSFNELPQAMSPREPDVETFKKAFKERQLELYTTRGLENVASVLDPALKKSDREILQALRSAPQTSLRKFQPDVGLGLEKLEETLKTYETAKKYAGTDTSRYFGEVASSVMFSEAQTDRGVVLRPSATGQLMNVMGIPYETAMEARIPLMAAAGALMPGGVVRRVATMAAGAIGQELLAEGLSLVGADDAALKVENALLPNKAGVDYMLASGAYDTSWLGITDYRPLRTEKSNYADRVFANYQMPEFQGLGMYQALGRTNVDPNSTLGRVAFGIDTAADLFLDVEGFYAKGLSALPHAAQTAYSLSKVMPEGYRLQGAMAAGAPKTYSRVRTTKRALEEGRGLREAYRAGAKAAEEADVLSVVHNVVEDAVRDAVNAGRNPLDSKMLSGPVRDEVFNTLRAAGIDPMAASKALAKVTDAVTNSLMDNVDLTLRREAVSNRGKRMLDNLRQTPEYRSHATALDDLVRRGTFTAKERDAALSLLEAQAHAYAGRVPGATPQEFFARTEIRTQMGPTPGPSGTPAAPVAAPAAPAAPVPTTPTPVVPAAPAPTTPAPVVPTAAPAPTTPAPVVLYTLPDNVQEFVNGGDRTIFDLTTPQGRADSALPENGLLGKTKDGKWQAFLVGGDGKLAPSSALHDDPLDAVAEFLDTVSPREEWDTSPTRVGPVLRGMPKLAVEAAIRSEPVEYLVAFAGDGQQVLRTTSNLEDGVEISYSDTVLAVHNGAVDFIHNHPLPENAARLNIVNPHLSPSDVYVALTHGMPSIEVVSDSGVFRLTSTTGWSGLGEPSFLAEFFDAYVAFDKKAEAEGARAYLDTKEKGGTYDQAATAFADAYAYAITRALEEDPRSAGAGAVFDFQPRVRDDFVGQGREVPGANALDEVVSSVGEPAAAVVADAPAVEPVAPSVEASAVAATPAGEALALFGGMRPVPRLPSDLVEYRPKVVLGGQWSPSGQRPTRDVYPKFDSGVDKALYLYARGSKNASAKARDWLLSVGVTEAEMGRLGASVAEYVKYQAPQGVGNSFTVPDMGWKQTAVSKGGLLSSSAASLPGKKPRAATLFSGGGLVEEGLRGLIDPVFAVEANPQIGASYKQAHGDHVRIQDVRSVDFEPAKGAEYLHASPVCKNFSVAKTLGGEQPLDLDTARATAKAIREIEPRVFTLENVEGYTNSEAMQIVKDALADQGYTFDVNTFNAADYGSATSRKRVLLRAVRDGELPPLPEKTGPSDWYARVEDIVEGLPDVKLAPFMEERLKRRGIDVENVDRPMIVMGGSKNRNVIPYAYAGGPAPTIKATPKEAHRIILPGGKVKDVTPRVLARITGLPDTYPLPAAKGLGQTIVGNGVPAELTRAVFGPLVERLTTPAIEREALSVAPAPTLRSSPVVLAQKPVEFSGLPSDIYGGLLRALKELPEVNRPGARSYIEGVVEGTMHLNDTADEIIADRVLEASGLGDRVSLLEVRNYLGLDRFLGVDDIPTRALQDSLETHGRQVIETDYEINDMATPMPDAVFYHGLTFFGESSAEADAFVAFAVRDQGNGKRELVIDYADFANPEISPTPVIGRVVRWAAENNIDTVSVLRTGDTTEGSVIAAAAYAAGNNAVDVSEGNLRFARIKLGADMVDDYLARQGSMVLRSSATPVDRLSLSHKDVTARVSELTEAAKRLQQGEISAEEYGRLVDKYKTVTPYEEVPFPASPEQALSALKKTSMEGAGKPGKETYYGVPSRTLQEGQRVGLRLDIPSYTKAETWVVSVHEPRTSTSTGGAGARIGYESTAAATDVVFGINEKAGLRIAAGDIPKSTIATMEGSWKPMTSTEAKAAADAALSDPAWRQVGMDPERHAYFYDRASMQPVVAADEVLQVGPLVLAKNPRYAETNTFLYASSYQVPSGPLVHVLDMVNDGSFAGFVRENAEVLRALGGDMWTDEFLKNFQHVVDPNTGRVTLTAAGSVQFQKLLEQHLTSKVSSPTLSSKLDKVFAMMQGLYLRARGINESPTLAMLQLDAALRPDIPIRNTLSRINAKLIYGRRTIYAADTAAERVGEAARRAVGQRAEAARTKATRAEASMALNIKKGDKTINVVDAVANAVAHVTTEHARRKLPTAKLVRVTTRSIIPEERLPIVRNTVRDQLLLAGIDPKDIAKQVDNTTGTISFTAAQQPKILALVNQMAGTWFGDRLPRELQGRRFTGTSMSIEAYNALVELMTDTAAGPGSVRDRMAEAVPKSMGYALYRAASDGAGKNLAVVRDTKNALLEKFHIEFDGKNHLDPGIVEIVERMKRELNEVKDWLREMADNAVRAKPDMWLPEIVLSVKSQLIPPVQVHALQDVLDPNGNLVRAGFVGLNKMFGEGQSFTVADLLNRLDDIEDAFSAFKPAGLDVISDLETTALAEAHRIRLGVASGSLDVDALPPADLAIMEDVSQILADGIQRRVQTVSDRAGEIGVAMAGVLDAGIMENFPTFERKVQLYSAFFEGEWDNLFDLGAQVGLTVALENFGEYQKKYSQAEALLAMVGRMRAQELMTQFSERLAMYGVGGNMAALTADYPVGSMSGRGSFQTRVSDYIKQIVNFGEMPQVDSKGRKIYEPEPPTGGEDLAAFAMAHELMAQWGFKFGKGEWKVHVLPDGTKTLLPQMVADNLNDAVQRQTGLAGAYRDVERARAPGKENVFDVPLTQRQQEAMAKAAKQQQTNTAIGAVVGGVAGATVGMPIVGAGVGALVGRDFNRAVNLLAEKLPVSLAYLKIGITTGIGLPNVPYYVANAFGGFMQALLGVGSAQTVRMLVRNPGFVAAVVTELVAPVNYHISAKPIITADGRVFTVREATRIAEAEGLSGSFIQAETVRSVADDLRAMEPTFYNKITKYPRMWQGLLTEMTAAIDNVYRVSAFVDEVRRGASTAEAAATARKIAFDYSALTDFEKSTMRQVIMFYSYQRRNIDLFFDTLLTNPGRIAAQLRTINHANETLLEGDAELVLPDYLRGRWMLSMRDAAKDSYSSGKVAVLAPQVPVMDVVGLFSNIINVGTEDANRALIGRATPWVQAPFVLGLGIEPFSGRELGSYDKVPRFLYELDMLVSGGVLVRGVFGAEWQSNKDPSSNDSDETSGYFQARNAKAYWIWRNLLEFPFAGRSITTLESMDRADLGVVEATVDAARAYRVSGGSDLDAFFLKVQSAIPSILTEGSTMPPLSDPNRYVPMPQEDLIAPRQGMTHMDEVRSWVGVRSVRVDNPAVALDRIYYEEGFKLGREAKELKRAEQFPSTR